MLLGNGLDLVEISRIKQIHQRRGGRFIERVFTEAEREYIMSKKNPYPSMAARFAAKEAVYKSLGFRDSGISWRDISILTSPGGRPHLSLRGKAALRAKKIGVRKIFISLTHGKEIAAAMVSVEGKDN